jgi:hypothetical protein
MVMTTALAVAGTLFGLAYSVLGIMALKHLNGASEADRVVGWSLWWFTDGNRYSPAGKRLCRLGGITFACAAACWVGSCAAMA